MSSSKPTPIRRRRRNSKPKLVTPAPAVDSTAVDLADVEEEDTEDLPEAAALQVDIPPAEPQHGSFLDRAKAKLGIADKPDVEPKAKASSGRLTKGQQQFVDLAAPISEQAGQMVANWMWSKIAGPQYAPYLTPDAETADKIMLPLTRIAARLVSIKYKGHVTPNQIDAAASLTAIAGYAIASYQAWQIMKKEEQYGRFAQEEASYNGGGPVQPRADHAGRTIDTKRQNHHDAASAVAVPPTPVEAGPAHPAPAENEGHGYPVESGGVDLSSLTPEQRRSYEKLRSLSMRDYESRRRRSGYAASV